MGAWYKYLFLISIVGLCAIGFQNCGQTYQANGDPYEIDNGIDVNLPIDGIPGDGMPGNNGNLPGGDVSDFSPALTCSTSSPGFISAVALGKRSGVDAVKISQPDGRSKVFNGAPVNSILLLERSISTQVYVTQLEFAGAQVRVKMTVNGNGVSEILNCQ